MRIDKQNGGCGLDGTLPFPVDLSPLLQPRQGRIIPVETPVAMGMVGVAALGILAFAFMRKKRIV